MIASFAAALAALANGRPFLSGAVRAVDVDASEFEGCFACTGFIIEVDLDHAIALSLAAAILLYDPKADRDSAVAAVERAEALADRWENAAAAFGISDSELDAAAFDLRRALGGAS